MLDGVMRPVIDPVVNRIGKILADRGVTADGVTLAGLALTTGIVGIGSALGVEQGLVVVGDVAAVAQPALLHAVLAGAGIAADAGLVVVDLDFGQPQRAAGDVEAVQAQRQADGFGAVLAHDDAAGPIEDL